MTILKAIRATIRLGEILLDVFRLPNGDYRLSKGQTCDVIGLDRKRLSQLLEKNSLKAIAGKGSSLSELVVKSSIEGNNTKVDLIPLEMAVLIWLESGTEKGKALVAASAIESLERRADAAFGVKRTEGERNLRLSLIVNSRVTRRSYTDILKDKLIEQYGLDGYKELAKNGYFKDITRRVNLHLFNTPHFKCDRENMTNDQLRDIELFEKQLERRANRFPDQTAEQLFQWMIDQF